MSDGASKLNPLKELWKWKSHHAILGTVEGVTLPAALDLRAKFSSDLFGQLQLQPLGQKSTSCLQLQPTDVHQQP